MSRKGLKYKTKDKLVKKLKVYLNKQGIQDYCVDIKKTIK